jgi:hypothetical protein
MLTEPMDKIAEEAPSPPCSEKELVSCDCSDGVEGYITGISLLA